jgi:hypothetical protein
MANDGVKNTNLAAGNNGYVLTADSNEPLGVKWAVGGSGSGSGGIISDQQILTATVSTNSTVPIVINNFTKTPLEGPYYIQFNGTYSISRSTQNMTIGVYKNGILLNGSSRTVNLNGSNLVYQFAMQYYTSVNGTDEINIRFNSTNNNTVVSLFVGNIVYSRVSNGVQLYSGTTFTLNSATPIEITDLTAAPNAGNYIVSYNYTFGLSKLNRAFTTGLYLNNSLINNSSRTLQTISNTRAIFQQNFLVTVGVAEEIRVKVNVSNTDTTLSLYDRNIILIPLN